MFINVINYFIWQFKKISRKTFAKNKYIETLNLRNPYRYYLFEELKDLYGSDIFSNKKILEIGPKDGEDTLRLQTLKPASITLIDLPLLKNENHHLNKYYKEFLKPNLDKLNVKSNLIFANFNYLKKEEYAELGKFDLIWFTGVLYHNPEQLKMLRKLYNLLNEEGVLVMETSTTRNTKLMNQTAIEIVVGGQYHFPTRKAVHLLLKMIGFEEIYQSKCFNRENYNKNNIRLAIIAKKKKNDVEGVYRDGYLYGEATSIS